ncbi:hydroxyacid dehydrogenase [Mycobacterium sp. 852013-50091_SCH5140682]|uniref:C-terminal binding protein n=1 Tax=Mycobacterium sp. 852013-50091_SCH5140682 TaxID=1834109 RepID=UPI0007EA0363|nr:C-terminal binding protein [Mycobacterium sp. 852013-50091_SCH5140682]OBC15777.1 hydroxyacid dehydrogenase [Mycobacterium sp. 852013-50091_SCH5140682]
MTNRDGQGTILVAPHHFPDLNREHALAEEFGYRLNAAADTDAFRDGLPEAEIVMITPYARLTAADFPVMGKCRAVIRYGIGYDNIDVSAASHAGIPVSIVPGTASEEVASHAFAMGLALARRLPTGDAAIRGFGWAGTIGYDTPVLSELEVGVVGMGRIGQHVARMYSAVGARVRAYDPFVAESFVPMSDLADVLENSDVVSLHLPLTDDTRNLISAEALARMRKGAVVVNVSRGGLIHEASLAAALHSGHIAGAGIDTFAHEPLDPEHPLRTAPNTILTPHIAWRSNRSTGALQEGAVERVRLALTGQPLIDVVTNGK